MENAERNSHKKFCKNPLAIIKTAECENLRKKVDLSIDKSLQI